MSRLDDILSDLPKPASRVIDPPYPSQRSKRVAEAKQQIKQLFLDMIGPDDNVGVDPDWPWAKSKHRDDFRDELRKKVNEL